MHELSVTENLLSLALKHAQAAGATRITRLSLVVGELSSIVDDSVQFYWDMVSQNTIAEGAVLEFRRVSGQLRCNDCGQQFDIADRDDFTCPACGSTQTVVAGGDEFRLESIDVETETEKATNHE